MIYRTLLENDMPYLGDDNDASSETGKLIDAIADQEINDDEVAAAQSAEYGADSVVEESFMAIAESEMQWNAVMQAIGLHELSETAMGRDVIYEAADIKGWFKAAKDKIVAFFKKVWQVIQRWAANITAQVHTNKKFYEKNAAKIKTGYEIYVKDKSLPRISGYPFKNFDAATATNKFKDFADNIKKLTNIADDMIRKAMEHETESHDFQALDNEITMIGEDFENIDELRDDLLKGIRGAEDRSDDVIMTPDEIKKALVDQDGAAKKVKTALSSSKKQFKAAITSLERLEKSLNSNSSDNENIKKTKESGLKVCVKFNKNLNTLLNATQIGRSVMLKCIAEYKAQARYYATKYVMYANRDKYKGFRNESAEYGFLGSLNLV